MPVSGGASGETKADKQGLPLPSASLLFLSPAQIQTQCVDCPVPVTRRVPYPVTVPQPFTKVVCVPQPYPVIKEVIRRVPVCVERTVQRCVTVDVPVRVPQPVQVPYPVDKTVERCVPYPVEKIVHRQVPYTVQKVCTALFLHPHVPFSANAGEPPRGTGCLSERVLCWRGLRVLLLSQTVCRQVPVPYEVCVPERVEVPVPVEQIVHRTVPYPVECIKRVTVPMPYEVTKVVDQPVRSAPVRLPRFGARERESAMGWSFCATPRLNVSPCLANTGPGGADRGEDCAGHPPGDGARDRAGPRARGAGRHQDCARARGAHDPEAGLVEEVHVEIRRTVWFEFVVGRVI